MDLIRSKADAVLFGANTLRAFKNAAKVKSKRLQLLRKARGLAASPINVVIANNVDFDPAWPFFADKKVTRILVVPESVPESELGPFRTTCQIFKYDPSDSWPKQVIACLKRMKCRNLLLEGGGGVMFPWVESDLIDEWNVTLVPKVIGGTTAPTMVEGDGFDAAHIKTYRLKSSKRQGDEVFLKYVRR
jgi:riboflavin biosynthesis pyrimidine reductase